MSRRGLPIPLACAFALLGGTGAHAQLLPPFQRAADAAVLIEATWELQGEYEGRLVRQYVDSNGSGFLIAPHGILITNNHVVDPAYLEAQVKRELPEVARLLDLRVRRTKLTVRAFSGTPEEIVRPGNVIRRDRKNDLALMSVNFGRDLPYLRLTSRVTLQVGAAIAVAGFPANTVMRSLVEDRAGRGTVVTVSQGRVTAIRRNRKDRARVIQLDAAVIGGNSGGPVVDAAGTAVGVLSATVGGGVNFAIAADTVYGFAENYLLPEDRSSEPPSDGTPPEAPVAAAVSDGETVILHLRNGSREQGVLKRQTADGVILKLPGLGTILYRSSEIARVEPLGE